MEFLNSIIRGAKFALFVTMAFLPAIRASHVGRGDRVQWMERSGPGEGTVIEWSGDRWKIRTLSGRDVYKSPNDISKKVNPRGGPPPAFQPPSGPVAAVPFHDFHPAVPFHHQSPPPPPKRTVPKFNVNQKVFINQVGGSQIQGFIQRNFGKVYDVAICKNGEPTGDIVQIEENRMEAYDERKDETKINRYPLDGKTIFIYDSTIHGGDGDVPYRTYKSTLRRSNEQGKYLIEMPPRNDDKRYNGKPQTRYLWSEKNKKNWTVSGDDVVEFSTPRVCVNGLYLKPFSEDEEGNHMEYYTMFNTDSRNYAVYVTKVSQARHMTRLSHPKFTKNLTITNWYAVPSVLGWGSRREVRSEIKNLELRPTRNNNSYRVFCDDIQLLHKTNGLEYTVTIDNGIPKPSSTRQSTSFSNGKYQLNSVYMERCFKTNTYLVTDEWE